MSSTYSQTRTESHMQTRLQQIPSPRLPWELTDAIIDFLYADTNHNADHRSESLYALSACSTVCSQFLLRSRFHAFATVQLWPWRAQRFFELIASPECTFARAITRVEVDDRARRLGGRAGTRGSSSTRTRTSWSRNATEKRGAGWSVERSGSRTRGTREDVHGEEDTEYMRFVDIMELAQHHFLRINIDITSLSISNVDWTGLPSTETALLRARMITAFPRLHALELHGATFHDMRELARVVGVFERLEKVVAKRTVFLKYPEHVMKGAESVVLGRQGVLKVMDLGRACTASGGGVGGGDGLEVLAMLTSVVDGLVELTIRGLRKAHTAHAQRMFREKGKALETVHLFLGDDPEVILSALDLSPLSSLRTIAIRGLQLSSLASSILPALLKRVEASFFDTVELGVRLDGSSALPQLDCSALQRILLEHRFFGMKTVRVIVEGDAANADRGIEGWIKAALPQLQGVINVRMSTDERLSPV